MVDPWLRDWGDPMNRDKTGYIGSECDGGFAQYVALPVSNVLRVECDWSDEIRGAALCLQHRREYADPSPRWGG